MVEFEVVDAWDRVKIEMARKQILVPTTLSRALQLTHDMPVSGEESNIVEQTAKRCLQKLMNSIGTCKRSFAMFNVGY